MIVLFVAGRAVGIGFDALLGEVIQIRLTVVLEIEEDGGKKH